MATILKVYINGNYMEKVTCDKRNGQLIGFIGNQKVTFYKFNLSDNHWLMCHDDRVRAYEFTESKKKFVDIVPSIKTNRHLGTNFQINERAVNVFMRDILPNMKFVSIHGTIVTYHNDLESAKSYVKDSLFTWETGFVKAYDNSIYKVMPNTFETCTELTVTYHYGVDKQNSFTWQQVIEIAKRYDMESSLIWKHEDNMTIAIFSHNGINTIVDSLEHIKGLILSSLNAKSNSYDLVIGDNTCDMWVKVYQGKDSDKIVEIHGYLGNKVIKFNADTMLSINPPGYEAKFVESKIVHYGQTILRKETLTHSPNQVNITMFTMGEKIKPVIGLFHSDNLKQSKLNKIEIGTTYNGGFDIAINDNVIGKIMHFAKLKEYRIYRNDLPCADSDFTTKDKQIALSFVALSHLSHELRLLGIECNVANLAIKIGNIKIDCLLKGTKFEYLVNLQAKGQLISMTSINEIAQIIKDCPMPVESPKIETPMPVVIEQPESVKPKESPMPVDNQSSDYRGLEYNQIWVVYNQHGAIGYLRVTKENDKEIWGKIIYSNQVESHEYSFSKKSYGTKDNSMYLAQRNKQDISTLIKQFLENTQDNMLFLNGMGGKTDSDRDKIFNLMKFNEVSGYAYFNNKGKFYTHMGHVLPLNEVKQLLESAYSGIDYLVPCPIRITDMPMVDRPQYNYQAFKLLSGQTVSQTRYIENGMKMSFNPTVSKQNDKYYFLFVGNMLEISEADYRLILQLDTPISSIKAELFNDEGKCIDSDLMCERVKHDKGRTTYNVLVGLKWVKFNREDKAKLNGKTVKCSIIRTNYNELNDYVENSKIKRLELMDITAFNGQSILDYQPTTQPESPMPVVLPVVELPQTESPMPEVLPVELPVEFSHYEVMSVLGFKIGKLENVKIAKWAISGNIGDNQFIFGRYMLLGQKDCHNMSLLPVYMGTKNEPRYTVYNNNHDLIGYSDHITKETFGTIQITINNTLYSFAKGSHGSDNGYYFVKSQIIKAESPMPVVLPELPVETLPELPVVEILPVNLISFIATKQKNHVIWHNGKIEIVATNTPTEINESIARGRERLINENDYGFVKTPKGSYRAISCFGNQHVSEKYIKQLAESPMPVVLPVVELPQIAPNKPKTVDLTQLIHMADCYINGKMAKNRACEVLKIMASESDYSALLSHYGLSPAPQIETPKVDSAPIAHAAPIEPAKTESTLPHLLPVPFINVKIVRNETIKNPRLYCYNILSNDELIGSITKFLGPWEVSIKDKAPMSFGSMGQAESWVMGLMA